MHAVFRPEAQRELLEAQAWYDARAEGLGLEFARAIETAIERALRMPEAYPQVDDQFRQVPVRKFPYSVIYHASGANLVVVSCFHHRREPGSWLPKADT